MDYKQAEFEQQLDFHRGEFMPDLPATPCYYCGKDNDNGDDVCDKCDESIG